MSVIVPSSVIVFVLDEVDLDAGVGRPSSRALASSVLIVLPADQMGKSFGGYPRFGGRLEADLINGPILSVLVNVFLQRLAWISVGTSSRVLFVMVVPSLLVRLLQSLPAACVTAGL